MPKPIQHSIAFLFLLLVGFFGPFVLSPVMSAEESVPERSHLAAAEENDSTSTLTPSQRKPPPRTARLKNGSAPWPSSGGELPAPTNLVATAGQTTSTLAWQYTDTTNIGFGIVINPNTNDEWWIDYVFETTYAAEHLFCGQSYSYGVQAYRYDEENDDYQTSEIVPIGATTDDCANLPAVANLSLEVTGTSASAITLTWDSYTEADNIEGLEILRFDYSPVPDLVVSVAATETMYTDSDLFLFCDESYSYAIRARAVDGVSPHISATIGTEPCPVRVSNLTATQVSTSPIEIEVKWSYSDSTSIERFDVVRFDPDDYYIFYNTPPTKTIFRDSDPSLRCDTNYEYMVWAYGEDFSYSDAEVVEITTQPCDPPDLTISASGPTTAASGQITHTLTVTNGDSISVPYLILYDVLPENTDFVTATHSGSFKQTTDEVLWQLGALAPGESQSVQLTLQANQTITNTSYGILTEVGRKLIAFKGQPAVTTQIDGEESGIQMCLNNLALPVTRFSPVSSYLLSTSHDQTSDGFVAKGDATNEKSSQARQVEAIKKAQARRHERALKSTLGASQSGQLKQEAQGEGTISGTVRLESGQPATQARVCGYWEGSGAPGGFLCQWTDDQGQFTLTGLNQNGSWFIKPLSNEDYYSSPWDDAVAYLDEVNPSYTLSDSFMVSITNLKGQFVLADGQNTPLTSTYGTIEALTEDGEVDWEAGWWDFVTDENGHFYAGELPANSDNTKYQVRLYDLPFDLRAQGYISPEPFTITIESPNSVTNLGEISVTKATKFITGRVTLSGGQGVADVEVEAIREDDFFDYQWAYTNQEGYYTITVNGGVWSVEPYLSPETDENWLFTGTLETVQFTQAPDVLEVKAANFELEEVTQFITGRVVLPGGDPFTGDQYRASIDIWDVDNERYYYRWLEPDGTFSLPAPDGFYEIFLWVNQDEQPYYAGGTIASREVQGNSVNLGQISLVPRFGTITGRVMERNSTNGVRDVFVDVWDAEGRWFGTESNADGYYTVTVPPGEWQLEPYPWQEEYIADGQLLSATIKASQREATANFKLTKVESRLTGRFVNEEPSNENVNVDASVYLADSDGKRIVTAYVDRGEFELPVPTDCQLSGPTPTCQVGTDLALNANHTITDDPNISSNSIVTFTVRENDAKIMGELRDPTTMQPVSELKGVVTLIPLTSNENRITPAKSALIVNGSYTLTHVGTGEFSLSYQLEREAEEVLALDKYLANPSLPFSVTVQMGEVLTRDLLLEQSESFEVKVISEDNNADYYPAVISCEQTIRSSSALDSLLGEPNQNSKRKCSKKKNKSKKCSKQNTPLFSRLFSNDSASNFEIEQYLFNEVTGEDTCWIEFGNAAANVGGNYINPPAQPLVDTITDTMTVPARRRNVYLVGQVRDQNGDLIRDGSVQVVAYSEGRDGQVERMTTDANGCYRLHVSETDANWTLTAYGERDGSYQTASASLTHPLTNTEGVIFGPTEWQLSSTGEAVIPPETHTFNRSQETSYEFALNNSQNVHVNIPAEAIATDNDNGGNQNNQVTLSIESVRAPNTGFYQVVGKAIKIKFIGTKQNGQSKSELNAPFLRDILVELPYDDAQLSGQGISANQLSVAQFSYQNNFWLPITDFTIDDEAKVIKVNLKQAVEALAIVAPPAVPEEPTAVELTNLSPQEHIRATWLLLLLFTIGLSIGWLGKRQFLKAL